MKSKRPNTNTAFLGTSALTNRPGWFFPKDIPILQKTKLFLTHTGKKKKKDKQIIHAHLLTCSPELKFLKTSVSLDNSWPTRKQNLSSFPHTYLVLHSLKEQTGSEDYLGTPMSNALPAYRWVRGTLKDAHHC